MAFMTGLSPLSDMTLPKAGMFSTASSCIGLIVGNDSLVKRWCKFAFGFDLYHKKEKCFVSQQSNILLMDPEPRVLFVVIVGVKFNLDLQDVLSARTRMNSEFRPA